MGAIISCLLGGAIVFHLLSRGFAGELPSSCGVLTFHSKERWESHYKNIKYSSQLVVIDFTASWCGPCELMAPLFNAMAQNLTDVEFIKIDVDELKEVAQKFNVVAMPTFVLLKNGNEVDRVFGANKGELENKIEKYRGYVPQASA